MDMKRIVSIEDLAEGRRQDLKSHAAYIRDMMVHPCFDSPEKIQGYHSEMKANIVLALRHVEDAQSRLARVRQFAFDMTSVYGEDGN